MTTTRLPDIIDALFTQATAALTDREVFDGFGAVSDPGTDYLMIGVDDPDAQDISAAGQAQQGWAHANYGSAARDEEGDINCVAVSWNGDGDAKKARDAAFSTVAGVATFLRADPTLGLDPTVRTDFGSKIVLNQDQNAQGATALVIFSVHYKARI